MASLIQPHWEALTPNTLQAFYKAGQLTFICNFYLAGGTGLALHLGHRYSIDLDFFAPGVTAVDPVQRDAIRIEFSDPSLTITYDSDGTFVASWREVGISFFRLSLYPLVQEPILVEGVPVATLPEIGAMKLAAIIDRGTRKDLVDLYFILQITDIEELFKVAAQKYFSIHSFPISAVRGMAYFVDAEKLPMPRMIDKTSWPKMKKFLEAQALKAGRAKLADLWE
jgi:predicted nucleotidyltransferase component of viral defense system